MSAPTLLGAPLTVHGRNILNNSLNDATSFDGEGGSSQSNQLTGSISVTVTKRLANGNLLVRGQKWITINQGREYVRLQGIVRPIDIGPTTPSVDHGRRRDHRLWRERHAQRRQQQGLAGALLRLQVDAVLSMRVAMQLSALLPRRGLAGGRRSRSRLRARRARRARQGSGLGRRRAHQPAGRLRPGGRTEWHRRSDHAGTLYGAEHRQHAGEVRRHGSRERRLADAAQERRGGQRYRRAAAVRQERARRSMSRWPRSATRAACAAGPADDAAARRRRRGLRDGAGQRAGQRLWRRGQGRLARQRQRAECRPHPQRRDRRARSADALRQ